MTMAEPDSVKLAAQGIPEGYFLLDITPTYNQHSMRREMQLFQLLPKGLWGRVVALQGEIVLHVEGGRSPARVEPGRPALIPADTPFRLEPTGKPVRFYLEHHHPPLAAPTKLRLGK